MHDQIRDGASRVRHFRAQTAALARRRDPDDPELLDARRSLKAERLAEYIQRTVDAAPPLTPAQRDRLALLLSPAGGGVQNGAA